MTGFILSFAFSLLGLILYFVWKAQAYLIAGRFNFTLWRVENLHRLGYAVLCLTLIMVVFTYVPESLEIIKSLMGVSFDVVDGMPNDASPLVLGVAVGAMVYRINNTNEKVKQLKN